jgi:hypothetical protein
MINCSERAAAPRRIVPTGIAIIHLTPVVEEESAESHD